jgi:hypothetical protein
VNHSSGRNTVRAWVGSLPFQRSSATGASTMTMMSPGCGMPLGNT